MLYKEWSTNPELVFYREVEELVMDIAISRYIPIYGSYDPTSLGLESKDFWDATHIYDFTVKKIFNDIALLYQQHRTIVRQ